MSPTREECLIKLADFLLEKAYEMVADGRLPHDASESDDPTIPDPP